MDKPTKPCGAKARSGNPCRLPAGPNGRCRFHGGASTGPRTASGRKACALAATKHGIYGKGYTDEELRHLDSLRDTDLTAEITLARIILMRLLKAAPDPIGEGEPSEDHNDEHWWGLVDRYLGRIGRLVDQRARVEGVRELIKQVEELKARLPALVRTARSNPPDQRHPYSSAKDLRPNPSVGTAAGDGMELPV